MSLIRPTCGSMDPHSDLLSPYVHSPVFAQDRGALRGKLLRFRVLRQGADK